jgi:hypothetical protein
MNRSRAWLKQANRFGVLIGRVVPLSGEAKPFPALGRLYVAPSPPKSPEERVGRHAYGRSRAAEAARTAGAELHRRLGLELNR